MKDIERDLKDILESMRAGLQKKYPELAEESLDNYAKMLAELAIEINHLKSIQDWNETEGFEF